MARIECEIQLNRKKTDIYTYLTVEETTYKECSNAQKTFSNLSTKTNLFNIFKFR
jgi:hypothetical protein